MVDIVARLLPRIHHGPACTRARGRHLLVAEVMLLTDWLVRERGGWGVDSAGLDSRGRTSEIFFYCTSVVSCPPRSKLELQTTCSVQQGAEL